MNSDPQYTITNKSTLQKMPTFFVGSILVICILPFLLTLLGVDFGSANKPYDIHWTQKAQPYEIIKAQFSSFSGAFVHTILEWSAFCIAALVALLALSHFKITRDVTTPIIGVAFFMAGCMDAFHTLAANHLIESVADSRDLIPFTWAICRLFNALILITGVGFLLFRPITKHKKSGIRFVIGISLLFGIIAYVIIHLSATSTQLPKTTYNDALFTRPFDVIPLALFAISGLFIFPLLYKRTSSLFIHALIISTIPQVISEAHMAFGSTALFDSHFNIGHFMKIIAR